MSTFGLDFPGLTSGRLLSWLRARRAALAGRSATLRWGLVALAVGGVSLAGYLASTALTPSDRAYLGAGRRYSSEDVHKIARALDKLRIDFHVGDDRRVAVAHGSFEAAGAAVSKLDLGPRTPEEIRDEESKASFWESPRDRETREQHERARVFESLIDGLAGVEHSFVLINRPRPRGGLRPSGRPMAFVRLETEGGRELPFSVVEAISSILTTSEDGLTPHAITIMDRSGRRYRDAGDPSLNALSSNRAREEDLRRQLLEKLDWVRGVRVDVQIAAVEPAESPELKAADSRSTANPNPDASAPAPGISVELNRALSIDLEPAEPAPPPPAAPKPRGRIMVNVPRSYYYINTHMPGGNEPSSEDYLALKDRTESHIRKAAELVVSENRAIAWEPLSLDVIQDELPIDRAPAEVAGKSRRWVYDWATAGAAGAAAAALVALGTWVFGGRQPVRRTRAFRGPHRYPRGSPAAIPPTERVLEFVRRNPEAAFSVLNRWTSQGGGRS